MHLEMQLQMENFIYIDQISRVKKLNKVNFKKLIQKSINIYKILVYSPI